MTTALKHTVIVLLVLLGAGIVMLVSLVMTHHEGAAYAVSDASASTLKMAVSDVAYKSPVGIGVTPKKAVIETVSESEKATEKREEIEVNKEIVATDEEVVVEPDTDWQAEETDYTYDEAAYCDSDDVDDGDSEDVVYDESEEAICNDGDYVDANVDGAWIAGSDFMFNGVHQDSSGYSYTYYSENVLPGGGLDIPGRHVGDEGYVCDENGNICLASDDFPYGTEISIPFGSGTGVVYDSGSGSGNLDVYVSW